jgi:KDO2-lipid IV(A) lauroyltransferase
MYGLSDFVSWLLRDVIKYRRNVVEENLRLSCLKVSETERENLIYEIYRNLSDILLEGIKSFSMSKKQVLNRHKVLNPEILDSYAKAGKSVILVTGHLGNWEWGSLSAGLQTSLRIVGFYKPMKNKLINAFIRRSRARFGTELAPIRQTSLSFEKFADKPSMFLMAADQNPTKVNLAYWTHFLGRETAFLHGPEKHAINNNHPVVFTEINRVKRGYYELVISELVNNPSTCTPGEITEKYVRKLEAVIMEKPGNWLWTHRRWKHTRKKD